MHFFIEFDDSDAPIKIQTRSLFTFGQLRSHEQELRSTVAAERKSCILCWSWQRVQLSIQSNVGLHFILWDSLVSLLLACWLWTWESAVKQLFFLYSFQLPIPDNNFKLTFLSTAQYSFSFSAELFSPALAGRYTLLTAANENVRKTVQLFALLTCGAFYRFFIVPGTRAAAQATSLLVFN